MTTPALLQQFFQQYQQAQAKRALGGIYALQGFDFQIECYLADLFQCLATNDMTGITSSVSAFEQLQDHTLVDSQHRVITVQAKRTLTNSTLKKALQEIAVVEAFRQQHSEFAELTIDYQIVTQRWDPCNQSGDSQSQNKEQNKQQDWASLLASLVNSSAKASPEHSQQYQLLNELQQQRRLLPVLVRQHPRWQALSAIWQKVRDPFALWRFAYLRTIKITTDTQSAAVIHEQICEKYREAHRNQQQHRRSLGEWLTPQRFTPVTGSANRNLDVGKQPNIRRLNSQQYMRRDTHLQAIIQQLQQQPWRPESAEAMPVYWIAGRSGSGKSVLLLQLVKELVERGKQVLWLGSKVASLPALLDIYLEQLHADKDIDRDNSAWPVPDYIAIDDIYTQATSRYSTSAGE